MDASEQRERVNRATLHSLFAPTKARWRHASRLLYLVATPLLPRTCGGQCQTFEFAAILPPHQSFRRTYSRYHIGARENKTELKKARDGARVARQKGTESSLHSSFVHQSRKNSIKPASFCLIAYVNLLIIRWLFVPCDISRKKWSIALLFRRSEAIVQVNLSIFNTKNQWQS